MAKRRMKIWLKKNPLTDDPNDFSGMLSSMGNIDMSGILDEIVEDGIEVKRDTLESSVKRFHNKVLDKLFSGFNVNTGLVYMRAVPKGPLYGKTWNPKKNWIEINITQGAGMRKEAAEVEVEILGELSDPIELYSLTDSTTGKTDGMLTKGRNAELKGSYIKLTGDNPAVGITFRNLSTGVETRLAPEDIVLNEPSRLLILVPATLDAGDYELTVKTQFTGANKLLKEPRSVTLGLPVIIG